MNLINIANKKSTIYLFSRDDKGKQVIKKDTSFLPYYFEPSEYGNHTSYDNKPLQLIHTREPKEVKEKRTNKSYSADLRYPKRYVIDKVDKIDKTDFRYLFIDIEIKSKEFPEPKEAKYPVSCITAYDSFTGEYKTWWLLDFPNEKIMLQDFVLYLQRVKPDIWASWYVGFDYVYLANRIKNFAKQISPINRVRGGEEKDVFYPCGISIVDYLKLFKKVFMREASYALDHIGEVHLGKGKTYKSLDFNSLDKKIPFRNKEDVEMMVELEEKYQLFPYYDEIRRLTFCDFEDLIYNSRLIEMLLFKEAKKKEVILPNKKENEVEGKIRGAIRNSLVSGDYYNCGKLDIDSAYPSVMIAFCLDKQNIRKQPEKGTIKIGNTYVKQDENALLPSVVRKLLVMKKDLKKKKKENPELSNLYNAVKGIVNSSYGVCLNRYFRLFDQKVGSATTYLVRDLLNYVRKRIEKTGRKVLYYDTDSLVLDVKDNIENEINNYVKDWGLEYGKENIDINFEYEGYFDSIFYLGRCHYYGWIHGKDKPEIKGVEVKRVSSSKYESYFQETLINKILKSQSTVENILDWIQKEKEEIKKKPLNEVGFPFKIQNKKYKSLPIFVRAYNNSKKLFDIKSNPGEILYYVFVKGFGRDKDGKPVNVLAFKDKEIDRSKIDWNQMMKRNIYNKATNIFQAKGWNEDLLLDPRQTRLI
jgi:DNA polymerase elongation subunit (family B)